MKVPVALSVAGSDSGGGAGIQADLRTFAALGVYGTSAITALTAQNPHEVAGIYGVKPGFVAEQVLAVLEAFPVAAAKTGMLFEAEIAAALIPFFKRSSMSWVLDPVMVSSSGARLCSEETLRLYQQELLPRAALATPNLPEAGWLLGLGDETEKLAGAEAVSNLARRFFDRFGCSVLLKGGHLRGEPVDVYYDGSVFQLFERQRIQGVNTHGTGCTLAAAVVAFLAHRQSLVEACRNAGDFVAKALRAPVDVCIPSVAGEAAKPLLGTGLA